MGITSLSMPEAALIALSGFVVVFIMLALLSVIIVLISKVVGSVAGNKAAAPLAATPAPASVPPRPAAPAPVQLTGVDDLTAACIMAIVSDETGIPLPELVFKHIKTL